MDVLVRCPECATALRVQAEHLGRRGQCGKCRLVFLLATPVGGKLLSDEPESPQPIEEPPPQPTPEPPARQPAQPKPGEPVFDLDEEPEDKPEAKQPRTRRTSRQADADEEPEAEQPRRRKAKTRREPKPSSRGLLLVLAGVFVVVFAGLAAGGFFLVRHLTADKADEPEVVANDPPQLPPKAPEGDQPAPTAGPTLTPGGLDPAPGGLTPQPANKPPESRSLKLDGPVSALYTAGEGRYVLFHLSTLRQLVVYDVIAGKVTATIPDIEPTAHIAGGRDRVFIGRRTRARVLSHDLRTGELLHTLFLPPNEQLQHLATSSSSDSPLVVVIHSGATRTQAKLYDPDTFLEIGHVVEDPGRAGSRRFPLSLSASPTHAAVSADGRTISLGDRLYTRTTTGYRAVPINPSSGLRPTGDGTLAVGNSLWGDDGRVLRLPDIRPNWLLPAAAGPCFIAVEYLKGRESRFTLYSGRDLAPLGELPAAEVSQWLARGNSTGAVSLHRHFAFLPEPGLVVFCPTGSDEVKFTQVDWPAMLAKSGGDVLFTSTPPATVTKGRPYTYSASAVTRNGQPSFTLETGPTGMAVTPEGKLSWTPDASFTDTSVDVRLVARTPDGKQAVQQFRVFLPLKSDSAVAANPPPKNPPLRPDEPPRPAKPPVNPVQPPASVVRGKEVKLPGPVTALAVAGSGRYICLHIAGNRQVAVFDVNEGKVVKYLPVGGDKTLLAAGAEKIFIVLPDDGVVQRWDLKTFEKEVAAPFTVKGKVKTALVGSAATGPLWLVGDGLFALDTKTLRPIDLTVDQKHNLHGIGEGVRVSADGRTLGTWQFRVSPAGQTVISLNDGGALKTSYRHDSVGHVTPGPDGRVIHTAIGRFTPDGKIIGERDGVNNFAPKGTSYSFSAAQGSALYLNVKFDRGLPAGQTRPTLEVHWASDGRQLAEFRGLTKNQFNHWDRESIGNDQRYMLFPLAKSLVVLPDTNDRLVVYPFDLDVVLEKAGQDYLLVEPPPTAPAIRGQAFAQALTIKSKKGGVKVKVESGPTGLSVSNEGKISWAVPADFADNEVVVIVTVSDASGKESLQTLRLEVRGEKGPVVAVAPKNPPVEPKKEGPVPPKDPPAPKEPAPKDEVTTVKLPGAATSVTVAAGGKLLILHLPQQKQLAVFDVAQGKVVKYLPMAEATVFTAAGQDHLFVANPTARVIQRYNLKTFEKEATVQQPIEGTVAGLRMGSASKGPLLICPKGDQWGAKPALVEPIKMKALPGGDKIPAAAAPFIRVSADGRLFGWRNSTGSEGHDMTLMEIVDGVPKPRTFWSGTSLLLPSPDGRYIYCGEGVFNSQFKKLYPSEGNNSFDKPFLPAASGSLFMQLEVGGGGRFPGDPMAVAKPGRVNFFLPGQYRPFGSIGEVEGLAGESYGYGAVRDPIMHDARVHLCPEAGRLVVVPMTNDKLILYPFNFEKLLTKSDTDYLLVTTEPPAEAGRGTLYGYTPAVLSRKGGVKVKLDSGPDGMKMVEGKLTWKVPADFKDKEVDVILTISDSTGQEVFQTFKLAVRDRKPDEKEAPEPVAPAQPGLPKPEPEKGPKAEPGKDPAPAGAIKPTPLKENRVEVKLPAAATDMCLGGGGRFIILHLASTRQLAVFDVNEGKVVKYLPVGGDGVKFAAGQDKLFVFVPSARAIQRWNLATFEKEVTAPLALTDVKGLLMGHASRGPLFVAAGADPRFAKEPGAFLDPKTFKPIEMKVNPYHGMKIEQMQPSADGSVVVGANDWMGSASATVTPGSVRMSHNGSAIAYLGGPSADGRYLYGNGIWTTDLKEVKGPGQAVYLPAAQGPFFLSLKPKTMEFYVAGQTQPFASINPPDIGAAPAAPGFGQVETIQLGRRFIWVPAAKLLVCLGMTDDKLFLLRVDVDELLKAAPTDYLVVFSTPPAEAVRGGRLDYPLDVRSKAGGVTLRLDTGPPGMKVSGTRLTWDVPAGFADKDASVILTVTDGKGQEIFHNFKLVIRDRKPDEELPPAPKEEPKAEKPAADPVPAKKAEPMDLTLKPAALQKDEQTVNLPSAATAVIPAAGGRLLLIHLPKERKLAVFDTAQAKIVKYLSVAEDEAKIAASRDKLVILLPGANVIQRWDLATLERELTVANPIDSPVKSLTMGSGSTGPLVVTTKAAENRFDSPTLLLYDPKTFKKSECKFGDGANMTFHPQYPPEVRVSANGDLITAWVWGLSPSGVYIWSREGKTYKGVYHHESWGALLPDAGGRTVYAGGTVTTADGKKLNDAPKGTVVPAVEGSLLLSFSGGADRFGRGQPQPLRASVHIDRDSRPLITLPEWKGLAAVAGLGLEQRIFLIPGAKLLAVLSESNDKLILHRFDLDALLEKSEVDYLFVTSHAPSSAVRGETLRYPVQVKSRKGGVKFTLDAGPKGMSIDAKGEIRWDVPKDFGEDSVTVILTISDKSGQETLYSFMLPVRAPGAKP